MQPLAGGEVEGRGEKEQVAAAVVRWEGLKKEDKGRKEEEGRGNGEGGSGRGREGGREGKREVESNSKRHCKLGVSVSYSAWIR